jgi:AmmeMemoRadiSam system protein B
MDITSYSRDEIKKGLDRAKSLRIDTPETVRILFSPFHITDTNIDEVLGIYSNISKDDFDTVVVIESHPGSSVRKLPMPSFKSISTSLGEVEANDKLRNDFCDEDDDFFIDDEAFDSDVSLYNQLMMLQSSLEDFSVLSIQVTDENSFIVKELAFALEEILASKNALLVFCCEMGANHKDELENVLEMFKSDNMTGLMNYLNGGESSIEGVGTFIAGLIVAKKWGLKLNFEPYAESGNKNLLTGYAEMQRQAILG